MACPPLITTRCFARARVVGNVAGSAASELGERINGIMYGAFSKLLAEDPRPPPPRAAEFTGVYVKIQSGTTPQMGCPFLPL